MLFPECIKVVFAIDGSGEIKARLHPCVAARDVKRRKAKKISDNLVQYYSTWRHKKCISPRDDEIMLIGTISKQTKKPGWLKADKETIENIFQHNEQVMRLAMPGLESIPLGCTNATDDIMLIYDTTNPLAKKDLP